MGKDTENVLGGPTIILMGIGAVVSAVLFYFMFKFADAGKFVNGSFNCIPDSSYFIWSCQSPCFHIQK